MAKTKTIEMYAVVDSDGDYEIGISEEDAIENYEGNVSSLKDVDGFRMIKIIVTVHLPEVVTVHGTVGEHPKDVLIVK